MDDIALWVTAIVVTVITVATFARRIGAPAPLLLVAVGAAFSFLPGVDVVQLNPDLVLLGFLPPLLFAAASTTSLVDLGKDRRQILGLSVFLVLFTAFGVALVAWKLLEVPFAVALALGAIVAPPDAVAATAIARKIGLPRRVVVILEGESLLNDATALVTVNTAKLIIVGSTVTWFSVSGNIVLASAGGALIGYVAYKLIVLARRQIKDSVTSVAISFVSPWIAYLPAEEVGSSGVIAVVVASLLLAHQAHLIQTAQSRVAERVNWSTITYLLENTVFLIIGLQVASIVGGIRGSALGGPKVVLIAVVVLFTVIGLRPIYLGGWQIVGRYVDLQRPLVSPREAIIASWAGMRGVVTIAAAFLLPEQTPERDSLIFIALVVTVGTLVLQGFTLGWVARKLDLHGPDPREDALREAQLVQASVSAGRKRLDKILQDEAVPQEIVHQLRQQGDRRANLVWERLGTGQAEDSQTPTSTYRRLRAQMLDSERAKVFAVRDRGVMDHEILDSVMQSLDLEESTILRHETQAARTRDSILLSPATHTSRCEHLQDAPMAVEPLTPGGCPECAREGRDPVHLRLCLSCGYVGCCDSSVGMHSNQHYLRTGHPVMRSFETGEAWRWCYVDRALG